MKKRSVAAILAAALILVSMVSMVAASSLTLGSPTVPSFFKASKCSSASADVTVVGGSATVAVPQGCESTDLKLYVGANGQASSVDFVPGTPSALPAGFASPKAALVTADTWPLGTELTIDTDPPIIDDEPFTCWTPEGICTVENLRYSDWGWPTKDSYNMAGTIKTTAATDQPWTLMVNLSSPVFGFTANYVWDFAGGLLIVESTSACDVVPRTFTATGKQWQDTVGPKKTQQFQIHGTLKDRSDLSENLRLLSCPPGA